MLPVRRITFVQFLIIWLTCWMTQSNCGPPDESRKPEKRHYCASTRIASVTYLLYIILYFVTSTQLAVRRYSYNYHTFLLKYILYFVVAPQSFSQTLR